MAIITLGINHKTAGVAVREKVAFDPALLPQVHQDIMQLDCVREIAILSTCNRTELYVAADSADFMGLLKWLSEYHDVALAELNESCYRYEDADAVGHMMRVAGGLDSLILGEPQILGQLKDAYSVAQQAQTIGSELDRLFQKTFSIAKQVRTDTAIGENPVSVAYAAVNLAQHIFTNLKKSRALLIGAGETIELVAKHLHDAGVASITVVNRTLERAEALAKQVNGEAAILSDMARVLPDADIIISSTAAPVPILGKGAVESALKRRKHRPMFMVDIAVPRDIEEEVGSLPDVYLYTVDDLKDIIEESHRSRQDAAQEAEQLIDLGVVDFMRQIKALDSVGTLKAYRQQAESLRDQELEKALKKLAKGDDPEKVLNFLANTLTNKLIHAPSSQLRKASADGRVEVNDWMQELFQLSGVELNAKQG
jgi:glutamyl-tRNA reductase